MNDRRKIAGFIHDAAMTQGADRQLLAIIARLQLETNDKLDRLLTLLQDDPHHTPPTVSHKG